MPAPGAFALAGKVVRITGDGFAVDGRMFAS
jgi:hypothetical protein